ncbi:putative ATP-dependent helicase YpvA [Sporosarcina sp. NCCP-2716]|uniref:ATP-dependent DNA helicase n=1 Tax=Sporosarcina sp. NCCP-2716 TaxID=2943679 RepID=UPI00203C80F1|nr:ATP-dependent DNA helicase [Sporosarcina sp. NCCP-2716]GKV67987.1 putative ATP-dependent helicase YpvA [Sporosarcina sp. NCCP-2716]
MAGKIPFALTREKTFFESLNEWIGDTLYDDLTEKGFDLRDEQIFMAFQIEQALREKEVLFAEAGVGTGKTIAYLLPAIAYARYTGKPALISCADETLIDQLVKQEGDIHKLGTALNLSIDVRLAKSRDQYLCLKRLEEMNRTGEEYAGQVEEQLPDFVYGNSSLAEVSPYGDRSSFPGLSDAEWSTINYHPIQQCGGCDLRNRCGQTIHRSEYRKSTDLIICSHDFFMEHIWTKESRKRQGQLPLLPDISMAVFDEGHLLEYAAQRALTYEVQDSTLLSLLERVMSDGVREETLQLMERLMETHELFFDYLSENAEDDGGERLAVQKTPELEKTAKEAIRLSHALLEEFVFDSELYVIPEYDLRMVEEYLEQYIYSLELFADHAEAVVWAEDREGELTLVIMPRLVTDVLQERLFSEQLPIIFSSATLSVQKDFSYLANSLGIRKYASFSIESPYDYDEVMELTIEPVPSGSKPAKLKGLLENEEQTLVLFKSKQSMEDFRAAYPPGELEGIVFEGDRELSSMVKEFQSKQWNAFCSYHLWEGLDLPHDALTRVIIYDLPLPPSDPLFDAKREHAESPMEEVDLPYMLLRLRQGAGRLIRTSTDSGSVRILLTEEETGLLPAFESIFPVRPKVLL